MRPSYITRILDREFSGAATLAHTPVMLWGPPGVGKSQIIAAIARSHGVRLIDIRLSQMEPTDLRGVPFRKGDLVEWSIPALLPDAIRYGDRGLTYVMPSPLANRFTHYEIEPHLDDWVSWAHASGIDSRVIAFLRF